MAGDGNLAYLLADKVGITYLHARHEVIVAARMSHLGTKTEWDCPCRGD